MNIIIMIPSLNPDEKLVNYVNLLAAEDFRHILVINDGSSAEYDKFFDEVAKHDNCTVIKHEVNKGKGRALKTGMKYVLDNFPDCIGIVTGDADGQHRLADTINVANALIEKDDRLVLGSRDFDSPNIPARSVFGNKMTSAVFGLMFGQRLMDTQTGLRGISRRIIPQMLEVKGERFEYEMNMLIECRKEKIEIFEIPIETVYIDENSSSHFRPIVDSVKVYLLLFRGFFTFIFASLTSTVLDIALYTLLAKLVLPESWAMRLFAATVIARIISSIFNFYMNKILVFESKGDTFKAAVKYYIVAAVQMMLSALGVSLLFKLLHWDEVIVKIIVDTTLFFINYFVQKKFVFKCNNK